MSYDLASRRHLDLAELNFQACIADEAHYLKSRGAKRTKTLMPVLMKSMEISKAISVTTNQNPILLVPCVEKDGRGHYQIQVLTSHPIDIQSAERESSKAQLKLIKTELETKQKKRAKGSASKKKGSKKQKKSTINPPATMGKSFKKARAGMMSICAEYANLE